MRVGKLFILFGFGFKYSDIEFSAAYGRRFDVSVFVGSAVALSDLVPQRSDFGAFILLAFTAEVPEDIEIRFVRFLFLISFVVILY